MYIGLSGLAHSEKFKRKNFPNLDNKYLRICQGYDSAASLISGSRVHAAVAEERFSRKKATGEFPIHAIEYCLSTAGVNIGDVDHIAHCFDYSPYEKEFSLDQFSSSRFKQVYSASRQINDLKQAFPTVSGLDEKFTAVPHHLAHAASAFYPSGFSNALIVIADGMGEHQSLTVATGGESGIDVLAQVPSIHSLGILYSVFTMYLGFEFNMDEYKVMGLAPYGNPRKYYKDVMQFVSLQEDGLHTIPLLFKNETDIERETYGGSLKVIQEKFGPIRNPESEITQVHKDIAAALQMVLQTAMMHLLKTWQAKTDLENLVMAGGVALNCSCNGVIKRSGTFNDMFVQPAAGDDGASLGAAMYVQGDKTQNFSELLVKQNMPFYGPDITDKEVEAVLPLYDNLNTLHCDEDAHVKNIAQRLLNGEIIAVCNGRMEFGPRALGSRSIIADPRVVGMREKINSLVKKREDFRPFAPAVVAESADTFFNIEPGDTSLYEYMLCVTHVKPEYQEKLPAITHVDGSARVQTVSKHNNERFWKLLMAFKSAGGIPMTVNTSFNVRGQPVVCNAKEAIDTFLDASLDSISIGNYIISRT